MHTIIDIALFLRKNGGFTRYIRLFQKPEMIRLMRAQAVLFLDAPAANSVSPSTVKNVDHASSIEKRQRAPLLQVLSEHTHG